MKLFASYILSFTNTDAIVSLLVICATKVLVKVHAAGVNPVETYIRSGTHSRKPDLPYTPGGDCAGVVEDVGEGVTKFKVCLF